MYKTHFGLNENPFNINTDPRYLYLTRRTQEALDCLTYGIEARKGFILLTGEVGTGKTTILNKLLDSLHQQRAATAFVFNPRMTASQLFDYMIADFGIPVTSKARSHVLFRLHQWLLDRYQAGEQTVLVVDEAQVLSLQALEEIRLLTNLETSTHKLLQIVLAGQPEVEKKLNQRDLRQLRQRIALRAKTLPLTLEETSGYILERLRIAGSNGDEIFTPEAIEAVHKHARGIPRVTNLLSEQSLVRAFMNREKSVSAEIVEQVALDFSLDELTIRQSPSLHGRAAPSAAAAAIKRARASTRPSTEPPGKRASSRPSGSIRLSSRYLCTAADRMASRSMSTPIPSRPIRTADCFR
jgi:general secretion pathway protein A